MSDTARSDRQLPSAHRPQGWAQVCEEQVRTLFDQISNRVDDYVARDMLTMETNLERSLDPGFMAADLLHSMFYLNDQLAGRPTPWRPLPSTRRRQRRFARAVLDAQQFEQFLEQTFEHLGSALGRRIGPSKAAERIAQARAYFAPVQQEACQRLRQGPKLVQFLSGPGAYTLVPGLWVLWSFLAGERRREREEVYEEMSVRASFLLGEPVYVGGFRPADTPLKVGASLLMAALGAAIAPTVAYSLIDVARLYWNHLDAIESLVLFGDVHPDELTLEDPLEDMNDEDTPDGLYSWLADLDLDEFSEEDEEDEEEKPKRPGLLFLVHALDAN
ncbi:MAG: hypothetical protein AAFX99_29335, partial [Myxococcota bacterium]